MSLCAFPLLRSEFKQILISILDTAVKDGDNSWYIPDNILPLPSNSSLAPPLGIQEPGSREDPPGWMKWIKDNFAAVSFKKLLVCGIVAPVSLNCFWAGQLQACVFLGCCFFPFLLAKNSASGKAIPVGWAVMVFSCLFTHMNNTYSENLWAVNTCKCYQLEILKALKL